MEDNALFQQLRSAWQRLSDRIGGRSVPVGAGPGGVDESRPGVAPPVDVFETDGEILLRADVPGASPENTKVHWDDGGELSFRVRRDPGAGETWGKEYPDWYRAFRVPDSARSGEATSSVKDGVLTVRIPKSGASAKRVPIAVG